VASAAASARPPPAPAADTVVRETVLLAAASALLFSITATHFELRVTDVGALLVSEGRVPYRDFWTIYAPGSFYATAAAFRLLGRELLVSNLLGIAVSTASVAAYHRFVRAVLPAQLAAAATLVVAAAFFATGYHDGLTSYPLASLGWFVAFGRLVRPSAVRRVRDLALAGAALGVAIACKHDVAGYAILAAAFALLAEPDPARPLRARLGEVAILAGGAAAVIAPCLLLLVAAGAGPDLWSDLVIFPAGIFPYVRWEELPLLPRLSRDPLELFHRLRVWVMVYGPVTAALVAGGVLLRRSARLDPAARRAALLAGAMLVPCTLATRVQINTHAITLPALAALLVGLALALGAGAAPRERRRTRLVWALAAISAAVYLVEPAFTLGLRWSDGVEPVGLPGLRGIRATHADAAAFRALSAAIAAAEPAEAPFLFVSRRNDVVPHASDLVAWLTPRRLVGRYPELHPGVADTRAVQQEIVAAAEAGPPPVVVREHRYPDAPLAALGARYRSHVEIDSPLLDEWLAAHYRSGRLFAVGEVSYEVMRRVNPASSASPGASTTTPSS